MLPVLRTSETSVPLRDFIPGTEMRIRSYSTRNLSRKTSTSNPLVVRANMVHQLLFNNIEGEVRTTPIDMFHQNFHKGTRELSHYITRLNRSDAPPRSVRMICALAGRARSTRSAAGRPCSDSRIVNDISNLGIRRKRYVSRLSAATAVAADISRPTSSEIVLSSSLVLRGQ